MYMQCMYFNLHVCSMQYLQSRATLFRFCDNKISIYGYGYHHWNNGRHCMEKQY